MNTNINAVLLYQVYGARKFEDEGGLPKYRLIADFLYEEDAREYMEKLKANPHDDLYKFYLKDAGK